MAYDVFGVNGGGTTTASPTYKTNSSTKNAGSNYDIFNIGSVQAVANPNKVAKAVAPKQQQQPQTSKPTSILSKIGTAAKDVAVGTKNFAEAGVKSAYDIGRGAAASGDIPGTKLNPTALANAHTAKATDFPAFAAPLARPIVQLGLTLRHPLSATTGTPATKSEQEILGKQPIQNVQAGVKSNYDAHSNLSPVKRTLLAAGYGAGQVAQDALAFTGLKSGLVDDVAHTAGKVNSVVKTVTGKDEAVNATIQAAKQSSLLDKVRASNTQERNIALGKTGITKANTKDIPVVTPASSTAGKSLLGKLTIKEANTTHVPIKGSSTSATGRASTIDDATYTKQTNKLSNAYDKESAAIKTAPPIKQQYLQDHIDTKYAGLQQKLDESAGKTQVTFPSKATTVPNTIPAAIAEDAKAKAAAHDALNPPPQPVAPAAPVAPVVPELTAKEKLSQTTEAAKIGALSKDNKPTTLLPSQTKDLPEIGGYTHSSDLVKDYATMLKETDKTPKVDGAKPIDYTAEAQKELASGNAQHGASAEYKQLVDREAKPAPVATTEQKANTDTSSGQASTPVETAVPARGTSKVALSIQEQAVKRGLTKDYGGAGGYDKINIEDQAKKAVALTKDRPALDAVIAGTKPLPDGLRATALIKAVEEDSVLGKDPEIINRLSQAEHLTGESSRSAQELRLAAERNPNSAVEHLKQVRDIGNKTFQKKTGKSFDKVVKDSIKEAKKEVLPVKTKDWNSFIDSLKC